jgi:hypothetical protein
MNPRTDKGFESLIFLEGISKRRTRDGCSEKKCCDKPRIEQSCNSISSFSGTHTEKSYSGGVPEAWQTALQDRPVAIFSGLL